MRRGTTRSSAARLVRCLNFFGRGIVQNKPAPMMEDLRGDLATLKKTLRHATVTKPSVRH